MKQQNISFFEKYLSIWVALCMVAGILISLYLPLIPETLKQLEYANVSFPIAILIWMMIFPMMLKVDFSSVVQSVRQPKGIVLTVIMNWIVKPFTMFGFAYVFLNILFGSFINPELANEYIAGAILLGAAHVPLWFLFGAN